MTITRLEDAPGGVLHLRIDDEGKLTADDYRDVLEPALESAAPDDIRVVIELEGDLPSMDLSAILADAKTGWKHRSGWTRVAVVCEQRWIQRTTEVFSVLAPGQMKGFDKGELAAAIGWAADADDD